MRKTKKTLAVLAIVAMVLTMIPLQVFAATTSATDATRLGGTTRIDTAIAIADAGFPNGADTVIVAPADDANVVDALAAAPLAGKTSPILLASKNGSDIASVNAEITKLGAKNVYLIGADANDTIANALSGVTVTKLAGADRTATAAAINAKLSSPAGTFVVGYNGTPDALSVASYAAANNYAIVLANPDGSVDASKIVGTKTYLVGGTGVVQDYAGATRLAGTDRFLTNKAVVDGLTYTYNKVYVANGNTLVDALAAAPLAAQANAPILLTDGSSVAAAADVNAKLTSSSAVVALGGTGAVSDTAKGLVTYAAPATLAVDSVSAINLNQIKVTFTGEVDKDSAETKGNYTLNNGGNGAVSATLDDPAWTGAPKVSLQSDNKTVLITIDSVVGGANPKLNNQIEATLAVKNILSADKTQTISDYSKTFTYTDTTIPTVLSATTLGNKVIQVKYSEDVQNAADSSNYRLNNSTLGTYSLDSISYDRAKNQATLNFSTALPAGNLTMTVSPDNSVMDLAGLKLMSQDVNVTVGDDQTAATVTGGSVASDKTYIDIQFSKPMAFVTDYKGAALMVDGLDLFARDNAALSVKSGSLRIANTAADWATFIAGGMHSVNIKQDGDNVYLQDAFGVKMAVSSATYSVTVDNTKPTVSSVTQTKAKTVEVKFSENVATASAESATNYSIKDVDGNTVTINTAALKSGYKDTVQLTLAAALKAGASNITVAAVADTAGNVMDTYTGSFTAKDLTGPSVTSANYTGQKVYVTYDEGVDTTAATNPDNYMYDGKALPSGTTVSSVASNQVKLTFPITTTLSAGKAFSVSANVCDTVGNKMSGFGWNGVLAAVGNSLDITQYDDNAAHLVMATDLRTMKFKVNAELKSIDLTDYGYKLAGGATVPLTSAAASIGFTNSSGKATVTITFKADFFKTNASYTGAGQAVTVIAGLNSGDVDTTNDTVAADGTTWAAGATFKAAQVVTDKIAPDLVATASLPVKTMDADSNGQIDHIIVTFTENMNTANLSTASFSVAGYTVKTVATDTNIPADIGVNALADGLGGAAPTVVIRVSERGTFDATATPAVTFNGTMKDTAGNAFVLPSSAKVATDGTLPTIASVAVNTVAGATNDTVAITFSEPMDATKATAAAGIAQFTIESPIGTLVPQGGAAAGALSADGKTLTINWNKDFNTNDTFKVIYAQGLAGDRIIDTSSNQLANVNKTGFVTGAVADATAPTLTSWTMDMNSNGDAKNIALTFSEPVTAANLDLSKISVDSIVPAAPQVLTGGTKVQTASNVITINKLGEAIVNGINAAANIKNSGAAAYTLVLGAGAFTDGTTASAAVANFGVPTTFTADATALQLLTATSGVTKVVSLVFNDYLVTAYYADKTKFVTTGGLTPTVSVVKGANDLTVTLTGTAAIANGDTITVTAADAGTNAIDGAHDVGTSTGVDIAATWAIN